MAEVTAREVFDAALHIMDETPADTTYEVRAVQLLNTLLAEVSTAAVGWKWQDVGEFTALRSLDEPLKGIDRRLAFAALPYGLASQLYLDEDPVRAGSWWQIYQERLALCKRERPADWEPIGDVYGGGEYNWTTRW